MALYSFVARSLRIYLPRFLTAFLQRGALVVAKTCRGTVGATPRLPKKVVVSKQNRHGRYADVRVQICLGPWSKHLQQSWAWDLT